MASSTTDVEMKPVEEQQTTSSGESTIEGGESSQDQKSQSSLKPGFRRYNLLDMVEEASVDDDGKQVPPKFKLTKRVFTARTPHAAAKKVANRGLTVIYLQEVNTKGKGLVHHFHGTKRPLQGNEITEYSKKIGANHKAIVKKQGTIRLVKKGSRKNKNASGPQKKNRKEATSKKVAASKRQASSKKATKKAPAAAKKSQAKAPAAKKGKAAEKAPVAAKKAPAATKKAPAAAKKARAAK